jgi:hypothetical protein
MKRTVSRLAWLTLAGVCLPHCSESNWARKRAAGHVTCEPTCTGDLRHWPAVLQSIYYVGKKLECMMISRCTVQMWKLVLSCSYTWLWRKTNLTKREMAVPRQNTEPPSQGPRWSSSTASCHSLLKLPDPPNACNQHVHVTQRTTLGAKRIYNFWYILKISGLLQCDASLGMCFRISYNKTNWMH